MDKLRLGATSPPSLVVTKLDAQFFDPIPDGGLLATRCLHEPRVKAGEEEGLMSPLPSVNVPLKAPAPHERRAQCKLGSVSRTEKGSSPSLIAKDSIHSEAPGHLQLYSLSLFLVH